MKTRHIAAILIAAIVIPFGAITAYQHFRTVTPNQAAGDAARCVGWSESVAAQIEAQYVPRSQPSGVDGGVILMFQHAHVVVVSEHGDCGPVEELAIVSATPMKDFPPMARIRAPKQDYLLYLIEMHGDSYEFAAVRAGTAIVHSPDPPPEQPDPNHSI